MEDFAALASSSTSSSPAVSPTATRTSRHLKRLSLSTSLPLPQCDSPLSGSTSAPGSAKSSVMTTPVRSHQHQPRNLRLSLSGGSPLNYASSPPGALPSPADESPTARRGPASAPPFRQNHARRMSSISYSSATEQLPSLVPSPSSKASSPEQHLLRSTPHGSPELVQGGFLSPSKSASAMGAQPTLTEVNADLLSFIAKKERRCLDLREELKRHETELAVLKKKWETIVAKSLASSPVPVTATARTSSPPRTLPASPHTLDISLLSSTFDSPSDDLDAEIGESVQAAKAWVGGVFGKVMGAVVSGAPSDDATTAASGNPSTSLSVLREEEEEGGSASSEDAEADGDGEGGKNRRDSQASVASEALSDFGFSSSAASSRRPRSRPTSMSGLSESTSIESGLSHVSPGSSPPTSSATMPTMTASGGAAAATHARRRSTFDLGWSSIGKRLAQVAESDTFKGTKRATLNFVDTFERTLTETLGPLDPPPLSAGVHQPADAPLTTPSDAESSLERKDEGSTVRKDAKSASWSWADLLDQQPPPPNPSGTTVPAKKVKGGTVSPAGAAAAAVAPKIGGYRRPSMTPAAQPTLQSSRAIEEADEVDGDDASWGL